MLVFSPHKSEAQEGPQIYSILQTKPGREPLGPKILLEKVEFLHVSFRAKSIQNSCLHTRPNLSGSWAGSFSKVKKFIVLFS
ncbi:hypothetical protein COB52_05030 [Candidatus Kaiserbacteria bacterium]|nr:MAG: hypothetical protein COB52_05030 [Candidatus Kaiserbacteria bacterium]